jgi:hypothetical protein
MPWQFTDHHVRPNVFYWSPKAYKERDEVKSRRDQAHKAFLEAKVGLSCTCVSWGAMLGGGGASSGAHPAPLRA